VSADTLRVLLDTDIGNDIDDAVCLAYLLAHPRCDLMGVTTVSADPVARAKLASVLCRAAGRSVPILPGAAEPLARPPLQGPPAQAALTRWDHETSFPRGEAVEFLRRTIRAHPGEVTLVAIGPLTNVALLFAVDPEIPALLRSLVLMGGIFVSGGPLRREWNIRNDPHAAARVFAAPVARHRAVGLDVTLRVELAPESFLKRCAEAPLLRPVTDMSAAWFAEVPRIRFHDPLAAATVFEPALCSYATGSVSVVCEGEQTAGLTAWQPAENGPHEIAIDVDPQAVIDHYFDVLKAFQPQG
jgi:purine nucleosidase